MRVLLVDDNPDDRLLAQRMLRQEFGALCATEAKTADELSSALEAGSFDLVVTDYSLRWTDGLQVLAAVKNRWRACPVVMFTGTGSEQIAVEAMKSGLDDYVVKTREHARRLPAAARNALNAARLRERERLSMQLLQRAGEAARVGAFVDSLEGPSPLRWSDPMFDIMGVPRGDPPSRDRALDAFPPSVVKLLRESMRAMQVDGVPLEVEVPLRPEAGGAEWVRIYAVPRMEGGRCIEISGAVQDVSDRKRVEREAARAANTERERIGSDLHDDLGQILTGLGLHVHALRRASASEAGRKSLDESIAQLERTTDRAREACRRLAHAYVAPTAAASLMQALAQLARDVPDRVRCLVAGDELPSSASAQMATELFRIAQEAVNNAVRHSGCTTIRVSLDAQPDSFSLTVEDDGRGMPVSVVTGIGLVSMRNRAARVGAVLTITPRPAGGTRIRATLPIDQPVRQPSPRT